MAASENVTKNHRISLRLPTKTATRATCVKGSLGLGPNLALKILDVSETGLRLVTKAAIEQGQEVEVTLVGPTQGRPVKLLGNVVWCRPGDTEGVYTVGARFQKRLSFRDFQELVTRKT